MLKNEVVSHSFLGNLLVKKDTPVGYHIGIIVGLDRVELLISVAAFPLYVYGLRRGQDCLTLSSVVQAPFIYKVYI